MTLTEEQQEFTEENHNLIYRFAFINHLDIDEYYDILAIALCKAVCKFDKTKGYAFSTFAFSCMKNEVRHYLKDKKNKIENIEKMISLDYEYSYDISKTEIFTLGDIIPDRTAEIENTAVNKRLCEQFSETLNQQHREVFDCLLEGFSQREIAWHINLSKQRVGQIVGQIRKNWIQFTS